MINFTHYSLHKLYISHFTWLTLHSTLCILQFALYTLDISELTHSLQFPYKQKNNQQNKNKQILNLISERVRTMRKP